MAAPADVGLFPDTETVAAAVLAEHFQLPAGQYGSSTPANLDQLPLFLQVVRYGGADDGVTDDAALDIDWFAPKRATALDYARRTHQYLLPGRRFAAGSLIDTVVTSVGPVERPREGTMRRFGGSYTVSARRVQA